MDNDILALERKCLLGYHIPTITIPHPYTKARSSKSISTICLKLSDIVPNYLTVTNLIFFYAV